MEDYKSALDWIKEISDYGKYVNGYKKWTNKADKFIPILEEAIEKAERYDDLCE